MTRHFKKIVQQGDILVGGFNFGSGSSREQAATCLKYRKIQLVLAGSFSETYKRNAINNGFLVLEVPLLINDLKKQFGTKSLTVRTTLTAQIDFRKAQIFVGTHAYKIDPIGAAAQELIISDGLENWVKEPDIG